MRTPRTARTRRTWLRRLVLVSALALAGVSIVVWARRDLAERDPDAIRGDPDIWRRVTFSPGGAIAYLTIGRRRVGL